MIKTLGSANFAEIQVIGGAEPRGDGRGPGHCLRHHRVTFPWVQEQEIEGESLNHSELKWFFWVCSVFTLPTR